MAHLNQICIVYWFHYHWTIRILFKKKNKHLWTGVSSYWMQHRKYSSLFFSGVRIARSLVFCVMFCRSLFALFILTIVLSAVPDFPIGSIGLILGPQILGSHRPMCNTVIGLSHLCCRNVYSISDYCKILNTPYHLRLLLKLIKHTSIF